MDEEAQRRDDLPYRTTLFSFRREDRDNTIDLEDPEVMEFTGGFRLDMSDHVSQLELLTMLYHSVDLKTERCESSMGTEEKKTRYFVDNVLCYTCGQIGHLEKRCPQRQAPFCILCASEGHYKYNCPQRVCMRCYNCGHCARDCQERRDRRGCATCRECTGGRHSRMSCPRAWRAYELIRAPKGAVERGCPLCLSRSHFADDCSSRRTGLLVFSSDFAWIARTSQKRRRGP